GARALATQGGRPAHRRWSSTVARHARTAESSGTALGVRSRRRAVPQVRHPDQIGQRNRGTTYLLVSALSGVTPGAVGAIGRRMSSHRELEKVLIRQERVLARQDETALLHPGHQFVARDLHLDAWTDRQLVLVEVD